MDRMHDKILDIGEQQALVARVLSGDQRAFQEIMRSTERLVAQIIYRMIVDSHDREDLLQDVYLKVYEHLPNFRFEAKLSTWIAQIAYNRCLSHLEKKRDLHWAVPEEKAELTSTAWHSNPDPMQAAASIHQKDRTAAMTWAIDSLPPIYKTLIVLFHQEELSYLEIAEITGLPEGTLKSYLFRARKELTNLIRKRYSIDSL